MPSATPTQAQISAVEITKISFDTRSTQMNEVIDNYQDVFFEHDQVMGNEKVTPMRICTHGSPIAQKAYRPPLHRRHTIDDEIDDMFAKSMIRPSQSPWASPVTVVPKRDQSSWFCVDYRKVNAITVKDNIHFLIFRTFSIS